MTVETRVAIIGAGPYGLATAAHLRGGGLEPLVLGRVMGAWERMPRGMLLRSFREATSIGDPEGRLTIDRFGRERARPVATPVPIADFVEYGRWFQERAVPEPDSRFATLLERDPKGFRLALEDGTEIFARKVVVAAGIEPFAHLPPELVLIDSGLVSHSSSHSAFDGFRGKRLLILGAGQSGLEWAALAHEAGADVEIVSRRPLRYLRGEEVHNRAGVFRGFLYPQWGVGPPGLNVLMGQPAAFRRLPEQFAERLARRAIRPAGATWLRRRLASVAVTTDTGIAEVDKIGRRLNVQLEDGSVRRVDHLIAATGYRIDFSRYSFLAPKLVEEIQRVDGFPRLTSAYESSVPGLHFVGAVAAASMGPGMRFVSHSRWAAAAVARRVTRSG